MAIFRNITGDHLTFDPVGDATGTGPDETVEVDGTVVDELDDAYVVELSRQVVDGYDPPGEDGYAKPRMVAERRLWPKSTWAAADPPKRAGKNTKSSDEEQA